jgi:ribosome-binding factor A
MAGNRRVYQVGERIRELIANHLLHTADPRFNLVTITSVMVSPDLRSAKVYWVVSFLSGQDRQERIQEVTDAFSSAERLFRGMLGKPLGIRFVPELKFFYDDTLDTAENVERLMEKIKPSEEVSK